MTYLTRTVCHCSLLLVLIALIVGGCGSSPGLCPCPSGGATIEAPGAVAAISTDAPCTVSEVGTDHVLVEGTNSCQVRIQLTNGTVYTSLVKFTPGGGCCPDTNFGTAGPLELVDAGSTG